MATYTQTRLAGPTLLTTSYANIYTVGSGEITIVKQIIVCNTDSSERTFSICLLKDGDTSAAEPDDVIFSAVALDPGETRLINLSLVMTYGTGGDAIYAKASTANKITITASGIVES
jgi:hypothetical protein